MIPVTLDRTNGTTTTYIQTGNDITLPMGAAVYVMELFIVELHSYVYWLHHTTKGTITGTIQGSIDTGVSQGIYTVVVTATASSTTVTAVYTLVLSSMKFFQRVKYYITKPFKAIYSWFSHTCTPVHHTTSQGFLGAAGAVLPTAVTTLVSIYPHTIIRILLGQPKQYRSRY
ncbi:putative Ig domain-containing protein [Tropheryma whipplei]|uniref:putative Ig domain-containing protein n=1 Tax=Tropheryma whipplei TaxID=2039 RepID=UPI0011D05E0A|nr:putative Ig domain-containing protein [Tropheryma whipplei]